MKMPSSILITGANRGIGLGLVKQYLTVPTIKYIFATARQPNNAMELRSLKDDRLKILKMDIECDKSIEEARNLVSSSLGSFGLNLLINNAGQLLPTTHYLTSFKRDPFIKLYQTNTIGSLAVIQSFLPLLRVASSQKDYSDDYLGVDRAAIINISSSLASIKNNYDGSGTFGSLAYRMCKTALNQVGKTLSIDLKDDKILTTQICPGWVKTDMGGQIAYLTVEDSVSSIVNSIGKLDISHNGGFFNRHLKPIPF